MGPFSGSSHIYLQFSLEAPEKILKEFCLECLKCEHVQKEDNGILWNARISPVSQYRKVIGSMPVCSDVKASPNHLISIHAHLGSVLFLGKLENIHLKTVRGWVSVSKSATQ